DAYAAYSLRKLSSTYTGPAIRVRRSSDDAEQDIGFGANDFLDTAALTAFVGSGDGYVTTWYSQIPGKPDAVQTDPALQPLVVDAGSVIYTEYGHPTIYFRGESEGDADRLTASGFAESIYLNNYAFWGVMRVDGYGEGEDTWLGLGTSHDKAWNGAFLRSGTQHYINTSNARFSGGPAIIEKQNRFVLMANGGFEAKLWTNNTIAGTRSLADEPDLNNNNSASVVSIGHELTGVVSEFVVFPYFAQDELVKAFYVNVAEKWEVGPTVWNENAILPQTFDYQVVLYDWLETLTVQDVALTMGQTFTWDEAALSIDQIADLWLQVTHLTTSRVVRAEPEWYVLDAGNGKGIEATGDVRIWHEPGSEYGGNPARSWANEPAFLYHLDIPLSGGGQGNPYYQDRALGLRALVVAVVDMMMYHDALLDGGYGAWGDMYGKAFLSWAEAYLYCKDLLPANVQAAFEEGMSYFLDHAISGVSSPRAVNTNMDMFFVEGAAVFHQATDDPVLKDKCARAVKRWLFGYEDGVIDTHHKVFKLFQDGGVFHPAGFINEGGQPDVFYGGESILHTLGALVRTTDRITGVTDPDWQFMIEVNRRLQEVRTYQQFYDPGSYNTPTPSSNKHYVAGAGYVGRTGAGVPKGQADENFKRFSMADLFADEGRWLVHNENGKIVLPELWEMRDDITTVLADRTSQMSEMYVGTPPIWNGWSPWVKQTPYLPPVGWYTRLKNAIDADDALIYPPAQRPGYYYNRAFGGPPTGDNYWAYKNTDGITEFGFFVEAQPRQGTYGGWYGGKIETFWTNKTGVVILNRHGKGGCDPVDDEDSGCWNNLEYKAGHHVWGRDENGKGFTTLMLKGYELQRTAVFNLEAAIPSVTVTNVFNDPSLEVTSSRSGEETGYELEGSVSVVNKIEAISNGARVTHTVISDGEDMITELWASIPVYLRDYRSEDGWGRQTYMQDTSIEYWDGFGWQYMPEDQNGDGIPELVSTTKLRLGRDYGLGEGVQYAYIGFEVPQKVRLSTQIYEDPYQTKSRVRTVHFDMHGNPGTAIPMPTNKSLQYTITTTEPGGG
ncbi:MAG: hypothetical protein D6816_09180, partial [Bacteroidetes bacterium]